MEKMLAFVGDAKVVFVIPLPRYVLSGCCADTEHVSNRLSGELAAEFTGAEKCLREAADLGEKTGKARLLTILSFFDSCESPPQDLTTVDGASIWADDGVQLTSNPSRVAARKLWGLSNMPMLWVYDIKTMRVVYPLSEHVNIFPVRLCLHSH